MWFSYLWNGLHKLVRLTELYLSVPWNVRFLQIGIRQRLGLRGLEPLLFYARQSFGRGGPFCFCRGIFRRGAYSAGREFVL